MQAAASIANLKLSGHRPSGSILRKTRTKLKSRSGLLFGLEHNESCSSGRPGETEQQSAGFSLFVRMGCRSRATAVTNESSDGPVSTYLLQPQQCRRR